MASTEFARRMVVDPMVLDLRPVERRGARMPVDRKRSALDLRAGLCVFVAMIVAQCLARAVADALHPQLSDAGGALLETFAVAIVLGVAAWRLLWLPLTARTVPAAVLASAPIGPGRHLRLVD